MVTVEMKRACRCFAAKEQAGAAMIDGGWGLAERARIMKLPTLLLFAAGWLLPFGLASAVAAGTAAREVSKADTIVLPKVDMRESLFTDVLEFLHMRSAQLDPDGAGMNFLVKEVPPPDVDKESESEFGPLPRVTFEMKNASLREIAAKMAELAKGHVRIDRFAVVLTVPGEGGKGVTPAPRPKLATAFGVDGEKLTRPLQETKLPKLKLGSTVEGALETIKKEAQPLLPEGTKLNIVVRTKLAQSRWVNLEATQIPVLEALRYVVELGGLEMVIGEAGVMVREGRD